VSLINDALKRAQDGTGDSEAKDQAWVEPVEDAPRKPEQESAKPPRRRRRWPFLLLLLLLAAGIGVYYLVFNRGEALKRAVAEVAASWMRAEKTIPSGAQPSTPAPTKTADASGHGEADTPAATDAAQAAPSESQAAPPETRSASADSSYPGSLLEPPDALPEAMVAAAPDAAEALEGSAYPESLLATPSPEAAPAVPAAEPGQESLAETTPLQPPNENLAEVAPADSPEAPEGPGAEVAIRNPFTPVVPSAAPEKSVSEPDRAADEAAEANAAPEPQAGNPEAGDATAPVESSETTDAPAVPAKADADAEVETAATATKEPVAETKDGVQGKAVVVADAGPAQPPVADAIVASVEETDDGEAPAEDAAEGPMPPPLIDTSGYELSTIMVGPKGGSAVINGVCVRRGSEIGDARVLEIRARSVLLAIDGQQVAIGL
jgi:hypothetical protein